MTTTVHPIELVDEPTPTAADYARRIQRKQLRVKALENRRETIARELAAQRNEQAAILAAGSGAPKINARALVELREEDAAVTTALEHLAREIADLEQARREATLDEARAAENARVADARAAARALEDCVRQLVDPAAGMIGAAIAALDEAMGAVREAQNAHDSEMRRANPNSTMMPSDRNAEVWKQHRALFPVVEAIRTYQRQMPAPATPPAA